MACEEFDPEVAGLYIERLLSGRETARFEGHLSACTYCRQSVVSLAQLAQADAAFVPAAGEETAVVTPITRAGEQAVESRPVWMDRVKALLLPLATPRFALAAVALIALGVSLPLLLSNAVHPSIVAFVVIYVAFFAH